MTKYIDRYYLNGEEYGIKFAGTPEFNKLIEDAVIDAYGTSAITTNNSSGVFVEGNNIYMGCWSTQFAVMDKATYTSLVSNYYNITNPWGICATADENVVYYTLYDSKLYTGTITPGDISTLSNISNYDTASVGLSRDCCCSPDGKKVYVGFHEGSKIVEYTLTTTGDLSSVTTYTRTYSSSDYKVNGVGISPDGKYIFVIEQDGDNGDKIIQFELATAWDLSSINSTEVSRINSPFPGGRTWGIHISRDGSGFYLNSNEKILYHYTW